MLPIAPRLVVTNSMIGPTYSLGVRIIARTYGSETLILLPGSGRSWGDLISLTLPSGRVTVGD